MWCATFVRYQETPCAWGIDTRATGLCGHTARHLSYALRFVSLFTGYDPVLGNQFGTV